MTVHARHADEAPGQDERAAHADAFISYSHHDLAFAVQLRSALTANGKIVFLDESDIPPAARWELELKTAIESAHSFLFVISPYAIASSQCMMELDHAAELNKRIIPINHRSVAAGLVPEMLRPLQWIPGRGRFDDDFDPALEQVVTAIDTDLDWVRQHTDWGEKAIEWAEQHRERSFLLRGKELEAAERWLRGGSGKAPAPSALQTEYVRESRRAVVRRRRWTRAVATTALSVVGALGIIALILRATAVSNEDVAQSRHLAASAESLASTNPELGIRLALNALDIAYTAQADVALRDNLSDFQGVNTLKVGAAVNQAAYSRDGRLVVTADRRGRVRVWNAQSGQPTGVTITEPPGPHGVEMRAAEVVGPTEVVTASFGGHLRRWDWHTGKQTRDFNADFGIEDAALSPDGTEIAIGGDNGIALVAGGPSHAVIREPGRGTFWSVALSPGGKLLLTGDDDGTARVWSAITGRPTGLVLGSPYTDTKIFDASFSPDGKRIVTADSDGVARVWDASTGRPTNISLREPDGSGLYGAAFSHDGQLIVTASADGTARVWDATTGAQVTVLAGHGGIVTSAQFSPSDKEVLSSSIDGTARIWDAAPRERASSLMVPHGVTIYSSSFSPDGGTLVAATNAGSALFDATSGGATSGILSRSADETAEFSPDGTRILIASLAGVATQWDTDTGRQAGAVIHQPGLTSAQFSHDGKEIVTASQDGVARIWNARTGAPIGVAMREPQSSGLVNALQTAAFSPNGRLVVTAGIADGTARVWNAMTDRPTGVVINEHTGVGVDSAQFSPNGTQILTASSDGTTRTWDAATGKPTGLVLKEPNGAPIRSAVFSPDGSRIATLSGDGAVTIWTTTGMALTHYQATPGAQDVSFSRAGTEVAAGGNVWSTEVAGPIAAVVRLARERVVRPLTVAERAKYLGKITG